MNILMMTNTYKPILGGLEKSIEAFTRAHRKRGHRVIIVAPEMEGMKPEEDVIRIPSIQNFNGTDFAIQVPVPGILTEALGDFKADIVHSHHPFLVGDTALRMAYKYNVPLVFTHHTLYEQNIHYVGTETDALKKFVIELATGYANLADQAFAPSESVKLLMQDRGVTTPIEVVPTGLDIERFAPANGKNYRAEFDLPEKAFIIGHLGRLAPEKNLEFLIKAVSLYMNKNKDAHFLVVGKGPSEEILKNTFHEVGLGDRLHYTGPLIGEALLHAYQAMDVFVFASQSETQGLVLAESMASGTPVIGVDAPGVREVVKNEENGRLLPKENAEDFAEAIDWMYNTTDKKKEEMKKKCLETAQEFSMDKCVDKALRIYASLIRDKFVRRASTDSAWSKTLRLIQAHWDIAKNLTKATTEAILNPDEEAKKAALQDNEFTGPLV